MRPRTELSQLSKLLNAFVNSRVSRTFAVDGETGLLSLELWTPENPAAVRGRASPGWWRLWVASVTRKLSFVSVVWPYRVRVRSLCSMRQASLNVGCPVSLPDSELYFQRLALNPTLCGLKDSRTGRDGGRPDGLRFHQLSTTWTF